MPAEAGTSRDTAYRYRDERIAVLAAQANDLHTAPLNPRVRGSSPWRRTNDIRGI